MQPGSPWAAFSAAYFSMTIERILPASCTLPTGQPSSMNAPWFTVSLAIRSPLPASTSTMLIVVVPMSMPIACM